MPLPVQSAVLRVHRGRYEGSLEYSLFEVLVQLLEADLIEAVMDDEAFQVPWLPLA